MFPTIPEISSCFKMFNIKSMYLVLVGVRSFKIKTDSFKTFDVGVSWWSSG